MSKRHSLSTSSNVLKRSRLELEVTQQELAAFHEPLPPDNDDWGEDPDEDELFILASQACENAGVCNTKTNAQRTFNINSRITSIQNPNTDAKQGSSHFKNLVDSSQNVIDVTFDEGERSIKYYDNSDCSATSLNNSNSNLSNKENSKTRLNKNNDVDEFVKDTSNNGSSLRNYYKTGITNMPTNEQVQHLLEKLKTLEVNNEKLKGDYNTLMDKCLMKDGEVSILRLQVKNMQSQISMTKSNHIKNQEMTQIEWNEKLKQSKAEVEKFASNIEFKNLEIINLKERCKVLESNKIKFVEPQPNTMDTNLKWTGYNFTQNMNSSICKFPSNVLKQTSSTKEQSAQAEMKSHCHRINILPKTSYSIMKSIHKSIFHRSSVETPIVFNSNRQSQFDERSNFSYIKKKMVPMSDTSTVIRKCKSFFQDTEKVDLLYQNLKILMNTPDDQLDGDKCVETAIFIILAARDLLIRSLEELKELGNKSTSQTTREMDEKYFELSGKNLDLLIHKDVFDGNSWFTDEQCIDCRRIVAVLAVLCKYIKPLAPYILGHSTTVGIGYRDIIDELNKTFQFKSTATEIDKDSTFLDIVYTICKLIGEIGCSLFYTGMLSSLCDLLHSCIEHVNEAEVHVKIYKIIWALVALRPHARVILNITKLLDQLTVNENVLALLCHNSESGNLKLDYNEGVAVYNDDTCFLQILCNNIEVWSSHFLQIEDIETMFIFTNCILKLHRNGTKMTIPWAKYNVDNKCLCSIVLSRCLCLCLHKCAFLYRDHVLYLDKNLHKKVNSTIRAGIIVLNFSILNDVEFIFRLSDYESYYHMFVLTCKTIENHLQLQDIHKDALLDLSESIISIADNKEKSFPEGNEKWEKCFLAFEDTD